LEELGIEDVGTFFGLFVYFFGDLLYFTVIWYIFCVSVQLYLEKFGSPALTNLFIA
jgi:hypothetical protein